MLSLIRENHVLARHLFVKGSPKSLRVYNMFTADLSPLMSNGCDNEEAQLMNWAQFVEGNVLWHFVYYYLMALLLGFDGRITVFSPNNEEHELSLTL